jgi:hypothetical protein
MEHAEAPQSVGCSWCMALSDLLVRVAASAALRKRTGALEAGAISMVSSDSALIPDLEVIAIDLVEATSVRRLRVKLGQGGAARIVLVSPDCGSLGPRRAVRAGAQSLVLEDQVERALGPAWNERSARRSGAVARGTRRRPGRLAQR